ncbi:GDP-mannose pyrophosphatase [Paraburkholderia xenovorans]|uniref:GDP-mannose pyrophosphatase n=1 Tax=Paraburkholderia xenovorans TaxID=36873 RepID=UPI0038B832FE
MYSSEAPMVNRNRVQTLFVEQLSNRSQKLELHTLQYERSDGSSQVLEREIYTVDDGAAGLLCDLTRRMVVLVKQFRLPVYLRGESGWTLEAPAGFLDCASPEERVKLEIAEEAGYRVSDVKKVFEALMIPGSVTHVVHCFIAPYTPADRVNRGGGLVEEGEDIEVVELLIDDAVRMIATGEIVDGKTIMLLLHAALCVFRGS